MAQKTNTFATFNAVGNREELADAIYRISPEETPFVSSIGKGKAESVMPEWQTDALAAAANNKVEQGNEAARGRKPQLGSEFLTLQRLKTGIWLEIPLRLRMDAMDMTLADALAACRSNVVSRYVVHHRRSYRADVQAGSPVFRDRITKAFTEARDLAGITGDDAPTFHEIRSLSKRTYMAQGNVDTKALLGHTTEKTANLYADPRGAEPLRVRVS